jgi:hypothetical protein
MICIGRPLPEPWKVELAAAVLTGVPVPKAASETGTTTWYERISGGVRLASGEGVAVAHVRHPDPTAEALRWQACEAQLVQAVGRLRALRRDEPFFLDIVSDVPLPIVVDEAVTWKAACPERWADMAPAGVLLTTPEHIQLAFPELAASLKAARLVAPTHALFPIKDFSIGKRACVEAVIYKRRGKGRPATAYLLPNAPPDITAWLAERLGPIDWARPAAEPEAAGRRPETLATSDDRDARERTRGDVDETPADMEAPVPSPAFAFEPPPLPPDAIPPAPIFGVMIDQLARVGRSGRAFVGEQCWPMPRPPWRDLLASPDGGGRPPDPGPAPPPTAGGRPGSASPVPQALGARSCCPSPEWPA